MRALRAGVRAGQARIGCVGAGTVLLGVFVGSLHAAGLDPEAAHMGWGLTVLLYAVAVSFVALGLGMVGVALFRSQPDAADLERVLQETPIEVVSAKRMVAIRYGLVPAAGEGILGQHQAHITSVSGRTWVLTARAHQVTAILDLVARCSPSARIEGR